MNNSIDKAPSSDAAIALCTTLQMVTFGVLINMFVCVLWTTVNLYFISRALYFATILSPVDKSTSQIRPDLASNAVVHNDAVFG